MAELEQICDVEKVEQTSNKHTNTQQARKERKTDSAEVKEKIRRNAGRRGKNKTESTDKERTRNKHKKKEENI